MKQPNLYGCTEETLDSLLLMLLPPTDHEYTPLHDQQNVCEESENICISFLKLLLKMLRENAGFPIPKVSQLYSVPLFVFSLLIIRKIGCGRIKKIIII